MGACSDSPRPLWVGSTTHLPDFYKGGRFYWFCRRCVAHALLASSRPYGWAGTIADANDCAREHWLVCPHTQRIFGRVIAARTRLT